MRRALGWMVVKVAQQYGDNLMSGNCTCKNGYNGKWYVTCIIPKF